MLIFFVEKPPVIKNDIATASKPSSPEVKMPEDAKQVKKSISIKDSLKNGTKDLEQVNVKEGEQAYESSSDEIKNKAFDLDEENEAEAWLADA